MTVHDALWPCDDCQDNRRHVSARNLTGLRIISSGVQWFRTLFKACPWCLGTEFLGP